MIHSAPKMLHEKKRCPAFLSEPAVREANPVRFNELRGGRDVSVCHARSSRSTRTRQPGVSPEAVLGETLRLSYGPVVLAIAVLRCEDKTHQKRTRRITNVGETGAMLPQQLRRTSLI